MRKVTSKNLILTAYQVSLASINPRLTDCPTRVTHKALKTKSFLSQVTSINMPFLFAITFKTMHLSQLASSIWLTGTKLSTLQKSNLTFIKLKYRFANKNHAFCHKKGRLSTSCQATARHEAISALDAHKTNSKRAELPAK